MATEKKQTQGNQTLDNETLLENMKGIELENSQLKKQIEELKEKLAGNDPKAQESEQKIGQQAQQIDELNQMVDSLKAEKDELTAQLNDARAHANNKEGESAGNDELLARITELEEKLAKAEDDKASQAKVNNELNEKNIELTEKADRAITLTELGYKIGKALAEKLSQIYGKKITLAKILEDYLIRYNVTEHYNLWFHKFALSEEEILTIAQTVYPDIDDFDQLVKMLKHEA